MAKLKRMCEICGKHNATQKHHRFPQTRFSRKTYGWLIDEDFNKVDACSYCNASHANIPEEFHWDECRFRMEAWKAGYDLPQPSKVLSQKIMGGKFDESR